MQSEIPTEFILSGSKKSPPGRKSLRSLEGLTYRLLCCITDGALADPPGGRAGMWQHGKSIIPKPYRTWVLKVSETKSTSEKERPGTKLSDRRICENRRGSAQNLDEGGIRSQREKKASDLYPPIQRVKRGTTGRSGSWGPEQSPCSFLKRARRWRCGQNLTSVSLNASPVCSAKIRLPRSFGRGEVSQKEREWHKKPLSVQPNGHR